LAAVAAGLLTASLIVVPERAWAAPDKPDRPAPSGVLDEPAASARAKATNQRVEVETLRDEHSMTYARPDGSFVTEATLRPQRVRRADASWAAVDTTLRRGADGSIAPVASTLDVRFSGGGSGPFAELRDGKRSVGLTWPGPLPEPVLSGDTATYQNVLPGVDLQVRADADAFTHLLVIRSPKAAENLSSGRIPLGTELSGLSLRTEPGTGVVSAVDGTGAVAFEGPTPTMWDSRGTQAPAAKGGKATAKRAAAADEPPMPVEPRQGRVVAEVSAGKLTLVPDAAMLADPRTVYPVYVDPTWTKKTATKTAWSVLRQTWPNQSNYKATSLGNGDANYGVLRAGYSNWESPTVRDRSLFSFDIKPFAYKHIYKATFSLTQQWTGAACGYNGTPRVELRWLKQGFSSSTVWNTAWNSSGSGWGEVLATSDAIQRYGYSCGPRKVEFNVTGKLAALTSKGQGGLNLGLRAKNESDKYSWKRFKNDAGLSIEYNSRPNAARDLKVQGKACASGAARPYLTNPTPTFSGTASDPDGGQQALTTRFYYWKQGQARGTVFAQGTSANPAPVTSAPTPALADATTYIFQAYTFDNVYDGTWSGTCEFTTDFVRPNVASDITSPDSVYPEYNPSNPNQPGSGGVGFSGVLRVQPPTSLPADVAYYRWTLNSAAVPDKNARVTPNGSKVADVTVRPRTDGVNILRVWSEDLAENLSTAPATYEFKVASGSGPAAEWTFDEASGSALDVTGHGNTAALGGSAGRTAGRAGVGTALSLNGTSGYAATSGTVTQPHPTTGVTVPVAPNGSFTATAWARLSATGGGVGNVVSYDGANNHALRLAYNGADNKWIYRVVATDTAGVAGLTISSASVGVAGKWTHLAIVWDAPALQMRLYVNGVLESTHTTTTAWSPHSNGSLLNIGRTRTGTGTFGQFFKGAVDDVQVRSYVVSPAALSDLAKPLPPTVTFPGGGSATVGDQVQVRFDPGGDTNVTHIKYSVGSATLNQTLTLNTAGAAQNLTIPAGPVGMMTVFAAAQAGSSGLVGPAANASIKVEGLAALSGRVFDNTQTPAAPRPGATVQLEPVGLTTTTDANGDYSFPGLAPGDYVVAASYGGGCGLVASQNLEVTKAETQNLHLEPARDSFGYGCVVDDMAFEPISGGTPLALQGVNAAPAQVTLPFPFFFYDQNAPHSTAWVDANGYLAFENPGGRHPNGSTTIPNAATPNAVVAPFWDDLVVDASASVLTATTGSAPFRQFIVEWRDVHRAGNTAERITFQAILDESGVIFFNYSGLDTTSDTERGSEAAVGIESPGGMVGLQYSFLDPVLANGKAVAILPSIVANPIETFDLSGTVTDAATGTAQAGVPVTLEPAGLTATTNAAGGYTFADVETGSYTVSAVTAPRCAKTADAQVDLVDSVSIDLPLRPVGDAMGTTCVEGPQTFLPADTVLPLTGDDAYLQISPPFPLTLYGQAYTTAWVDTNGVITFQAPDGASWDHGEIPSPPATNRPSGAVYPFWDDWMVDGDASVLTATTGSAPNRRFIVEWRNVRHFSDAAERVSFEAIFDEAGGDITFAYTGIDTADHERGSTATVGIEDAAGVVATQYLLAEPILTSGVGVRLHAGPPPVGTVDGTVRCNSTPAAGVEITAGGQTTTTGPDGTYQLTGVQADQYALTATAAGGACAGSTSVPVTVSTNDSETVDVDLTPGGGYRLATEPHALTPANDTVVPLTGDDATTQITLPFPVTLYGQTYSTAWVDTNGVVMFQPPDGAVWDVSPIPSPATTNRANAAVYPFWNDWVIDENASVRTATVGAAPNRKFVVEWRNALSWVNYYNRVTFQVIFEEGGDVVFAYTDLWPVHEEQGGNATVGIENADGTAAMQYLHRHPGLRDNTAIRIRPTP
jgi:hypothetical protein